MEIEKESEEKNLPYRKVDLRDYGPKLPVVPINGDGKPIQNPTFSFCDWNMETEEKLSAMKRKAKNSGQFVNQMLCDLIAELNGEDFQKKSKEERTLAINQMDFPNVMYMYMYLRFEEMGNEIRFDVSCPACGSLLSDFRADLGTLETRVKDSVENREKIYELKRPITLEDGKIITGLKLKITKWNAMESADQEDLKNDARMKRLMFEDSICGLHDENGPIEGFHDVKSVIRKLKKLDIEKCMFDVVEHNAGPFMAVKGKCTKCDSEWMKAIDWSYDYFFDSSSL